MSFFGRMGGWNIPTIALLPPSSDVDLDDDKKSDDKEKKFGCLSLGIILCAVIMTALVFFV